MRRVPRDGGAGAASPAAAAGDGGIERLCRNHYNQNRLPVGKFERIKSIIDADRTATVPMLKAKLSGGRITLDGVRGARRDWKDHDAANRCASVERQQFGAGAVGQGHVEDHDIERERGDRGLCFR